MKHIYAGTLLALLLAPLSALQAAESLAPLADQERLPAFSWEHVPRYVHIRKDTAFTDEEIRYLATFPLITFEKSTGNKDSGSTEAGTLKAARAVKAINPATKILYYRNVIVHYGGYAANATLKDIPGAFLVGRDGNDKLIRGHVQAYDLTNKALRDWWLANAKQVCSDPAIDGLFLDGVVKILEPAFLHSEIGEAKKAAELSGYETMVKDVRQLLGPQKLMLANVLRARFPDSGRSHMKAFDGSYIEGFEGAVGMSKKDYVAKGIESFQTAAQQGFIIAFTCGLGNNQQDADETPGSAAEISNPVNRGGDAKNRFNYQLAMFLICAEKYSYFDLKDSYDAKTSKTWMTRPPEYDRPLGAPNGQAVRNGYTYTREFAHASVHLDIEKQTGVFVWKNTSTLTGSESSPDAERVAADSDRDSLARATRIMRKIDKNGDGTFEINEDESAWRRYRQLDTNQDGALSIDELRKERVAYLESGGRKLNVVYKQIAGRELLLDLYYPATKNNQTDSPYPVIIYTHGGGWAAGSKQGVANGSFKVAFDKLLDNGFAVASVEYRLCRPESSITMRDCVIDCKDAVRYLSKNSDTLTLDPTRFFAMGDSAGGQIAQMLLLTSPDTLPGDKDLAAVPYKMLAGVSWYGPCDFEKMDLFNHDDRADFRDRFGPRILGTAPDAAKLERYREMSPINYLSKDSPPLLMIQGDKDTTIPVKHAYHMKQNADTVKAPLEIMIIRNAGHNWRKVDAEIDPSIETIIERTVQYFVDHL